MNWSKLEQDEIKTRVFEALRKNKNYINEQVLGVPASYLDPKVFSQDDTILKDAPFLSTMVANPNHIGCHTLDSSESFFTGTHEIEREVISICAEDIMKADVGTCDGYVASGGTEANIQALWIYRNFFVEEFKAEHKEIAILTSDCSHYSMAKGANLLNIPIYFVPTNYEFSVKLDEVRKVVGEAKSDGVKYFIVVVNMMTTMFGSVDDPEVYSIALENFPYKMHVDAAFGGFYYPFLNAGINLNFKNKEISSVTLDAHKMAQAPYGTGIFIIRKGLMKYTHTQKASYVEGEDCTLIGSRSGANAVSIWMILSKYGPHGWTEKVFVLQRRTDWLCEELYKRNITFFRNGSSNIVAMKSQSIPKEIAERFGLVPDDHHSPAWYKIVVMDHVTIEKLEPLLTAVDQLLTN